MIEISLFYTITSKQAGGVAVLTECSNSGMA